MDFIELEALGAASWNTWTACLQRLLPHGPGWPPGAPWWLASSGPGDDVSVATCLHYKMHGLGFGGGLHCLHGLHGLHGLKQT